MYKKDDLTELSDNLITVTKKFIATTKLPIHKIIIEDTSITIEYWSLQDDKIQISNFVFVNKPLYDNHG